MPTVDVRREDVNRCQGKTAMLFVGGSRAHHYQELFSDMGMEIVAAGYEFAHRDDYEGRKVLPDASRSTPTAGTSKKSKCVPDPRRAITPRKTPERNGAACRPADSSSAITRA